MHRHQTRINEITLIDVLGTPADIVGEAVETSCEKERLTKEIHHLTAREKWVLQMRFGIPDGDRRTQRDIAKALGISRSYVSRIEKYAITKLGKSLSEESFLAKKAKENNKIKNQ